MDGWKGIGQINTPSSTLHNEFYLHGANRKEDGNTGEGESAKLSGGSAKLSLVVSTFPW